MANITKEFLEEALGVEISSFDVKPGSNAGDNYSSILYSIDVGLTEEKSKEKYNNREKLHLLLKCFPANPARQAFLCIANTFWHEMKVYDTVIPNIVKFQEEVNPKFVYKPPFPQYYNGKSVDYSTFEKGVPRFCTDVLENYIIMADIRKDEGGFKLGNRLVGFDLDHSKLVFEAQAKLHAVSWAFKQKTGTSSLMEKYPFMANNAFEDLGEMMMEQLTKQNIALFKNVVQDSEEISDEKKQQFLGSLDRFQGINYEISMMYFSNKPLKNSNLTKDTILRVPRPTREDEESWLVLTHGDCWLNNMLFKYDEETGKPLEIALVDLQMTTEGDPFADIAYNVFTSTTAEFRKEHAEELLQLYTETFLKVCDDFGVEPLPGFDLEEVKRRFQRAKAFGFTMALMGLAIFLTEKKDAVDFETVEGEGMEAVLDKFLDIGKNIKGNSSYAKRVLGLVSELYEEGVI